MRKLSIYTVLILLGSLTLASCTYQRKAVPMTQVNAQIIFDTDDLEYIGDVTGQTQQSYFLFIPYGGRKYHAGSLIPQGGLGVQLPGNRGYNNALYDALQQKPDADFVMPVSFETTTHQQFMGRREILKVRFKAYKIKAK
ncbi:MAG: hypothetical protein ACKVOK_00770 [Flavobacteriales bacterium]